MFPRPSHLHAAAALLAVLLSVSDAAPTLPLWLGEGARFVAHPKGCPSGWVYASGEGWWRRELIPAGGTLSADAHDFGHLHSEMCLPHHMAPASPFLLNINTVLHQNPGTIKEIQVQDGSDPNSPNTPAFVDILTFRWLDKCTQLGGTVTMNGTVPGGAPYTCMWTDPTNVDIGGFSKSGLVRVKAVIFEETCDRVLELGTPFKMRAYVQSTVFVDNGHPDSGFLPEAPANNYLQAQGYGSMVNYTKAVLFMPPKVPVGGMYRPWIIVDKHVNSTPVARHSVELNANFHLDSPGAVLRNASGTFNGQLAVNLTAALGAGAKGWQKLNIQGKAVDPLTNATNTGALNVYFEVNHGEPPASSCGVAPVQTHAADGWASTASKYSYKGGWQFSSSKVNTTGTVTIAPPILAGTNGTSQRTAVFSYDLSFLQLPTGASNASVWVFSSNDGGVAGATVQAWDASNATLCVDSACGAPIGAGTLSPTNRWTEVKLDAAFVLRQMRCTGAVTFALALPAGTPATTGVLIGATLGQATPPLLVTRACGSTPVSVTC